MKKNNQKVSFFVAKKALLINFTGSSYHWGCYGTSIEIYHSLIERNYYVEIVNVDVTHFLSPTIEKILEFDDKDFYKRFCKINTPLTNSISQSDIIVVNGEGTLHSLGKAPLNLLYIMYISKKYLGKKVHLINFSCFPNGDLSMPEGATSIYPAIFKNLDIIAPRDHITKDILQQSGIRANQSFDCLPRFLNRYNLVNCHEPKGNILVTGGVYFNENRYEMMVNFVHYFLRKNIPVKFLLGAHFSPAFEDIKLQQRLKENPNLTKLEIVKASSIEEWIGEFKSASFLFSARFHHSIAALSIGTPFRYLRSNTPKIDAALETINEDVEEFVINENQNSTLINVAENSLLHSLSIKSEERVKNMLSLAKNNFITL